MLKKSETSAGYRFKSKNNLAQSAGVVIGAVVLIVVIIAYLMSIDANARKTVDVVQVKKELKANEIITKDKLASYSMLQAEYDNYGFVTTSEGARKRAVLLWDEANLVEGKYAAYQVRGGTVLFRDQVVDGRAKKTAYLYKLDEGKELLKLEVGNADTFGTIVAPGDRLNIRMTYKVKAPVEANIVGTYGTQPEDITVQEDLFRDITVVDILNSEGSSVFDIYYDVLNMTPKQREETMQSDTFKTKIRPAAFLLAVTSEEVDRYATNKLNNGISYTITILPRGENSVITDTLADLNKRVTQTTVIPEDSSTLE